MIHDHVYGTIPYGGPFAVGQYAQVDRIFSSTDVENYASLIGDFNPLHQPNSTELLDHPLRRSSESLVHGMLVASLFSRIFGTITPGAVYLQQSLRFVKPVYVGMSVTGRTRIMEIQNFKRKGGIILTCDTLVFYDDDDDDDYHKEDEAHVNDDDDKENNVTWIPKKSSWIITGEAKIWLPLASGQGTTPTAASSNR